MNNYEAVIGLEVHAQLLTKSKAFCSCSTEFGASPNTNTCPICLGHPGTLPHLNKSLVEYIVRMGLATNCRIRERSTFARKNYFYADLVKGYQITQHQDPICYDGHLDIELVDENRKAIGITRIHMEEDTGKAIHDLDIDTLLDYNRSGVPLIEIVSEPDIRNATEAYKYLTELKRILVYLGICTGNMEEGALRCDANVSVRPVGQIEFGTKTEVKNMNSFRNVEKAIDFEIKRQIELIEGGGRVVQETRMWDGQKQATRTMRSKETQNDYRYFTEPDLVPVIVSDTWKADIAKALVELPLPRKDRFCKQYSIPAYDSGVLVEDKDVADYYEAVCNSLQTKDAHHYKLVSNWLMTEVMHIIAERAISITQLGLSPALVAELVELFANDTISSRVAKDIFPEVVAKGTSPKEIIERDGLSQVSDTTAIEETVKRIIASNADSVEKYKAGRTNVLGFFVGQTMKEMSGKANPKIITDLVTKYLNM
ncbi:MAG: Asp-tRNA(Asn)/Glu-tRNA(Gln) amidotransferase subunit GatB [Ignavibacteria bacterium]|jgi:aspartyl-tRNA(Asn)/glutamyl-tRNA(Gln) amidotransferase subunit B|nr:Asp-tRNA(Asn)/Glu-tRNA(Gln) amidotransferase subunit GatB [Ignavibacteria bacterium]